VYGSSHTLSPQTPPRYQQKTTSDTEIRKNPSKNALSAPKIKNKEKTPNRFAVPGSSSLQAARKRIRFRRSFLYATHLLRRFSNLPAGFGSQSPNEISGSSPSALAHRADTLSAA